MATVDASVFVALFNAGHPQHATCMAWLREAIAEGEPLRAPVTALAEIAASMSDGTGDKQLARDVATQVRRTLAGTAAQVLELLGRTDAPPPPT